MDTFDITCTATLRPELLRRTLQSHIKYLFKEHVRRARFVINIDMVGTNDPLKTDAALGEIFDIIRSCNFFTTKWNVQPKGNFAKAWFWTMDQLDVSNDFFFNLEEDWEMVRDVDFEKMMKLMEEDPWLAHLRLSQFPSDNNRLKNWNKFLHWQGDYFQVLDEEKGTIGWCGHPSLNNIRFMMDCLPWMKRDSNPEKQIKHHNPYIKNVIDHYHFGSFHPQNTPAAVVDIGRAWMAKNGWTKSGNKAFFTEWTRVGGNNEQ